MKFTREDFVGHWDTSKDYCQDLADIANAKLQEWLSEAPTAYGNLPLRASSLWVIETPHTDGQKDTHYAKLVNIEELK